MEKENNKHLVTEFYDAFSTRQVIAGVNKRHRSIVHFLLNTGLKKDQSVLEIGCGIGTLSGLLLKQIKKGHLTALDLSPKSIQIAEKRLAKFKNKTLIAADINEWVSNKEFDVIVLPDVLEHIPLEQHQNLFIKLNKLLKSDGFILIHIPNPYHLDYCKRKGMTMQVVDQAVYLSLLVGNLKNSGLHISFLKIYSIWQKEGDYQVMVLEHEEKFKNFTPIKFKIPFWAKAMYKIKYEWEKINKKK